MWVYVIFLRMLRRTGFEVELITFFLSTLSLSLTASAYPYAVLKQAFCVLLGVILFFAMCWLLRDLNKAKKLIPILLGVAVVLLIANLAIGTVAFGSQNWISIAGFTFQPSELVKIVFIFVGAASLNELQQRRNLLIFMGFSVFCLCCLAIMGDFGTAIIFFATYLVIAFLRSGDFTKLFLVIGAAGLMGLMVLVGQEVSGQMVTLTKGNEGKTMDDEDVKSARFLGNDGDRFCWLMKEDDRDNDQGDANGSIPRRHALPPFLP